MSVCPTKQASWCVLAIAAGLIVECGCAGLSKPYPQKHLHALSPGEPTEAAAVVHRQVLRVDPVHVAQPFDAATFIYKTGPSQFETDYYNGFVCAPARLLTGVNWDWLARTHLFAAVTTADSAAEHQLVLETNITALYADFSAQSAQGAVIEAGFFLIDDASGRYDILFQKRYCQSQSMSDRSTEALIGAFNAAYGRILTSLSADLQSAELPDLAQPPTRTAPPPTSGPALTAG